MLACCLPVSSNMFQSLHYSPFQCPFSPFQCPFMSSVYILLTLPWDLLETFWRAFDDPLKLGWDLVGSWYAGFKILCNGVPHCSGLVNKGFPIQCASGLHPASHFQDSSSTVSMSGLGQQSLPSRVLQDFILHHSLSLYEYLTMVCQTSYVSFGGFYIRVYIWWCVMDLSYYSTVLELVLVQHCYYWV